MQIYEHAQAILIPLLLYMYIDIIIYDIIVMEEGKIINNIILQST